MTSERLQVGQAGEAEAVNYLRKAGYKIVETNYRCRHGEIDIIARERDILVIVEVRAKTGCSFGRPEESLNSNKSRRLHRLALHYLQAQKKLDKPCRIDLIAVMLDKRDCSLLSLKHIRGILAG